MVEAHANCRFYVEIDQKKEGVFTELAGLQVEMEVQEYAEGGNNSYVHRLPGRTKVSNITLKRGMTRSNELYKWYTQVCLGVIQRRHVSVLMYDSKGVEVRRWDFIDAYPVKWVGPQFAANGAVSAVETLELAHAGLQFE
jgi:phage tail-like protein